MIYEHGFWWPFHGRYNKTTTQHVNHIDLFIEPITTRRLVVQAGGNVGVYPLRLAKSFDVVHTFELTPDNFECLMLNIVGTPNIITHYGALGETIGTTGLHYDRENCGGHRIRRRIGDVPMQTIDSLELEECDLIWLDVEGYEAMILDGAIKTVEKYKPFIIIEKSPRWKKYGEVRPTRWLESRGYTKIMRIRSDIMFSHVDNNS